MQHRTPRASDILCGGSIRAARNRVLHRICANVLQEVITLAILTHGILTIKTYESPPPVAWGFNAEAIIARAQILRCPNAAIINSRR